MYQGKKIPARWQFLPVLLATAILLMAAVGLVLSDHGVRQLGLSAVLKPAPLEPALHNAQAAEQVVQRAWLLAQQAGAYDFRTEIEQTTYPAPALTNVGRPAQVESLYLEGATDTRAKEFQVAIWQGGSILHRDQAYEVRTEGAQSYGRPTGGEWQPIEDISAIFAPGRDALAYLQGIKQVQEVTATTENYRQFRFALDGPAFAETMRRQLEDELRRAGKLPPGITLDTPSLYRDIIGEGEIWLSRAGLPAQFQVTVNFPQGSDGSRVRAVIHTDFANFDADQLAHATAPLAAITRQAPPWLANQLGRLTLLDWPALGMQSTFLLALALGMLLVARVGRKRQVYALLNLTVLAAMLVTPLLQSTQVAAFHASCRRAGLGCQPPAAGSSRSRRRKRPGRTAAARNRRHAGGKSHRRGPASHAGVNGQRQRWRRRRAGTCSLCGACRLRQRWSHGFAGVPPGNQARQHRQRRRQAAR